MVPRVTEAAHVADAPAPETSRVGDLVVARMKELLVTGEWPVGSAVPPVRKLAAEFGTSTTTVRTAIRSLIDAGMLERRDNAQIHVVARDELGAALRRRAVTATAADVVEVAAVVQRAAAASAARRRTGTQPAGPTGGSGLAGIDAALDALGRAIDGDDDTAAVHADDAFRAAVVHASGNPLLVDLHAGLGAVVGQDGAALPSHPLDRTAARARRRVRTAIAAGDAARARRAADIAFGLPHPPPSGHADTVRRAQHWCLGAAVVLIAANLRPGVAAVSPLLADIRASVGLSGTAAGILTALPVLCFGLLAPVAPQLARALGIERALALALVTLCAGFALRAASSTTALFTGTALIGASIAIGNVLVPALIKRDFRQQIGLMVGLYTVAIAGSSAVAAGITVPIAGAAGLTWRSALGGWGLLTVVALLCWLPYTRHPRRAAGRSGSSGLALVRDRLAWQVTVFTGLQSLAYFATTSWLPVILINRGLTPTSAGLLTSVINIGAIGSGMGVPLLAARCRQQRGLAAGVTTVTALGVMGVVLLPGFELVSAATLGVGLGGSLGLAVTLITLRTPDAQSASLLSGLTQCVGFTLAAAGPLVVGAIHDLTGSWTVAMMLVVGLCIPQAVAGVLAGRARVVGSASRGSASAGAAAAGGRPPIKAGSQV